ncbi:protein MAIN-LIKE 1-like [Vigna angularis]|uniref:protein MAIN-LIKE 1-like n=1 Tax=Phaseolus angularis TaxID=3914 RepID=UPI0022B48232|nr:protein MAIN-LIKE 1-like [Vigna angularis]
MAYARQLPVDMSLLRLQDKHIVKSIWEGNERVICPRRHAIWLAKHVHEIDERIKNILHGAGFIHILQASSMEISHNLVTALVERWRVKTHTFHFPHGETTITLEDVALQLGLTIEGQVVTGISSGPLTVFCHQLLGDVPPENCVRGNKIKLSWLNNTFRQLPHRATEQIIEQYARAYMLIIIGSVMMLDTSASMVHLMYLPLLADLQNVSQYSWGSATLSCLYRALDHGTRADQDNIGGCMILLQCWAWERITCLSPELLEITEHEISSGAVFPLVKRWCRTTQSAFQDTTTVKQFRQKIDDLSP